MNIGKSEILRVNKLIFDYILKQNDEDLLSLLNGEKVIAIIPNEKFKNSKVKSTNNKINNAVGILKSFTTKKEVEEYLIKNKFTVKDLVMIAKECEVYIKAKARKNEVIDALVEGTVGAKIKMNILLQG